MNYQTDSLGQGETKWTGYPSTLLPGTWDLGKRGWRSPPTKFSHSPDPNDPDPPPNKVGDLESMRPAASHSTPIPSA